jgi:hypothetical protein
MPLNLFCTLSKNLILAHHLKSTNKGRQEEIKLTPSVIVSLMSKSVNIRLTLYLHLHLMKCQTTFVYGWLNLTTKHIAIISGMRKIIMELVVLSESTSIFWPLLLFWPVDLLHGRWYILPGLTG